jgi:cobyrinic acid a,c-diamide synthase
MTGFLIAGTSSGVGKTTVTLAIAAALRDRGKIVQLFKGGPDFLDTGHHSRISGRKSRNLDTWMLSHESNCDILRRGAVGADVVVVEGMMGLFDGKSGADEQGSSAEIAKLLRLPVVLVVDANKSARSIAALVLGFEVFDPELSLAGVILNRVASERHFETLEAAIVARCSTPVLGWLPREPAIAIPERHLGLQTAQESSDEDVERQVSVLSSVAERYLALDRIVALRCGLDTVAGSVSREVAKAGVRVGVAYDPAFMFYYEDNLELLREQGAEIVFFSPLADRGLPAMLDALYLGGGYPELHAAELSGNASMLNAVREFSESQRPIYAECGGMIYLAASLTTNDGKTHEMAGVLPGHVEMTTRLSRFGYVTVEFTQDCLLGPSGTVIRGHSFHYSQMTTTQEVSSSYRVDYSLSGRQEQEGFGIASANVLASYIHLHFGANPGVVENFLKAAVASRISGMPGSAVPVRDYPVPVSAEN